VASVLLVLGMLTYTVTAPFALGVIAASVVTRRWRSLWIGALPLILYGTWRVFASSYGIVGPETQPDFNNLLLIPAWSFQALGGSLVSLLGGRFGFASIERGDLTVTESMVGVFGTLLLLVTAVSVYRNHRNPRLIAISLFASQLLIWVT